MVESNAITKGLYLDLDTLLDTRLATIYKYDPTLAIKGIASGYYYDRIIDEFDYINHDAFSVLYRLRNNNTILNSFYTDIVDLIFGDINMLLTNPAITDEQKYIPIEINTYPYRISESMQMSITNYIKNMIPNTNITIDFMYKDITALTLTYVSEHYYGMYMYNGITWAVYAKEHENTLATNTVLTVPALLHKPLVLSSENDYNRLFDDVSKLLTSIIKLRFAPVKLFSTTLARDAIENTINKKR